MKKFDKKNAKYYVLMLAAYFVMSLGLGIVPRAILVWFGMALAVISMIYKLFSHNNSEGESEQDKKKKLFIPPEMLFVIALLALIECGGYHYVGGGGFPFWWMALLAGLPIGVFVGFKYIKPDSKLYVKILSVILSCLICFFMANVFAEHLNYALSTDEPQQYTAVVLNKDKYTSGGRSRRRHYQFLVEVEGERFYLEVKSKDYNAYDEGDEYRILRYNGAFGKAFFIPDP